MFLALSLDPLVASLSQRWLPRALAAMPMMTAGTAVIVSVGIVVAVPLLVVLKIVCRRVRGWERFAHLPG